MKKRRQGLLDTVLATMEEIKEKQANVVPLPEEIDHVTFNSTQFKDAMTLLNVTVEDVVGVARLEAEVNRLKRLLRDERIMPEEYKEKVKALGIQPEVVDAFVEEQKKTQKNLINKLLRTTKDIRDREEAEDKLAQESRKKRQIFFKNFKGQIDEAIHQEQKRADMSLMRKKSKFERLLIQRGVEQQVKEAEMGDQTLAPQSNYAKNKLLGKDHKGTKNVSLITKSKAIEERRKLYLRNRFYKSRVGPGDPMDEQFDKVEEARLRRDTLRQRKVDEMMVLAQAKSEQAAARKAKNDQEKAEKLMQAQIREANRHQAIMQQQWADARRADYISAQLREEDTRLGAIRDLKEKKTQAVRALRAQTLEKERELNRIFIKAKNDLNFNVGQALSKLGMELDQDQIDQHVLAHTQKLCVPPESITTPVVDMSISKPVAGKKLGRTKRPASAPPGGPGVSSGGETKPRARPTTASRVRPGTAKSGASMTGLGALREEDLESIGDIPEDEGIDHSAERLETLRIEQAKNLYHMVREEQEYEDERKRMIGAILPTQKKALERLFEKERSQASERIMRAAAENEMVLLQEMALMASKAEAEMEALGE